MGRTWGFIGLAIALAALAQTRSRAQEVTNPAERRRVLDAVRYHFFRAPVEVGTRLAVTLRVGELDPDSSSSLRNPVFDAIAERAFASLRLQSFRLTMEGGVETKLEVADWQITDSATVESAAWGMAYHFCGPIRFALDAHSELRLLAKEANVHVMVDSAGYRVTIDKIEKEVASFTIHVSSDPETSDLKILSCAARLPHPAGWSQVIYYYDPASPLPYFPARMLFSFNGRDPVFHLDEIAPLRRFGVFISDYYPKRQ